MWSIKTSDDHHEKRLRFTILHVKTFHNIIVLPPEVYYTSQPRLSSSFNMNGTVFFPSSFFYKNFGTFVQNPRKWFYKWHEDVLHHGLWVCKHPILNINHKNSPISYLGVFQQHWNSNCSWQIILTLFWYLPFLAYLIWNWHHQKWWFPPELIPGPLAHQSLEHPCQATPVTLPSQRFRTCIGPVSMT